MLALLIGGISAGFGSALILSALGVSASTAGILGVTIGVAIIFSVLAASLLNDPSMGIDVVAKEQEMEAALHKEYPNGVIPHTYIPEFDDKSALPPSENEWDPLKPPKAVTHGGYM